MQWGQAIGENGSTVAHEFLHDEHVSHHHEDDGSIHFDNSEESTQHIQDHCSSLPGGLFVPCLATAPLRLVTTATIHLVAYIPDPMLELPHRPPANALG